MARWAGGSFDEVNFPLRARHSPDTRFPHLTERPGTGYVGARLTSTPAKEVTVMDAGEVPLALARVIASRGGLRFVFAIDRTGRPIQGLVPWPCKSE